MPICKKCDAPFKTVQIIDDKQRNLGNRKYCLSCSPFGGKNTRQLHSRVAAEQTATVTTTCTVCFRVYEYNHAQTAGHNRTKCNSCVVNLRRFTFKQRCVDYKGGKCERCGYAKILRALSFHHRDPATKSFTIAGNHCLSWKKIQPELDKCILLCANCHFETHEELEVRAVLHKQ